jgi:HKD family nuclease
MIKDQPIKNLKWFFTHVVEKYVLRHFSKITYSGELSIDPHKASLVLMNHYSFNDGAILHRLARKVLLKNFKVMVVEAQLKAFIPLKYVGCFSVNKKSRAVIESLNYAADLLKEPSNMLGIYPQGEVYSMHLNRIHFESGLSHILKKSSDTSFQVIFGVTLLDYLDSFKPQARVYLQEYTGNYQLKDMETAYNEFYHLCKVKQQQLHRPPEIVIDK